MGNRKQAEKTRKLRKDNNLELLLKFILPKRMQFISDARPDDGLISYGADYNPELQTLYVFMNTHSEVYSFEKKKQKKAIPDTDGLISRVGGFYGNNNFILDPSHPNVRFSLFPHEYIMVHLNVWNYDKLVHDLARKHTCFGWTVREIYKRTHLKGGRKIVIYDIDIEFNIKTDTMVPKDEAQQITQAFDKIMAEKDPIVPYKHTDTSMPKQEAKKMSKSIDNIVAEKETNYYQKELVLN